MPDAGTSDPSARSIAFLPEESSHVLSVTARHYCEYANDSSPEFADSQSARLQTECQPHVVGAKQKPREPRAEKLQRLTLFGRQLHTWLDAKGISGPKELADSTKDAADPLDRIDVTNLSRWSYTRKKKVAKTKGTKPDEPSVMVEQEPGVYRVAAVAKALGLTIDEFLFTKPGVGAQLGQIRDDEVPVILALRDRKRKGFRDAVAQLLKEGR